MKQARLVVIVGALVCTDRGVAKASCALDDGTITVTNKSVSVSVLLANPPATRARVSLDQPSGAHHELEWDPAIESRLARQVILEPGTWTVTTTVEPSVQPGTSTFSMIATGPFVWNATGSTWAATYQGIVASELVVTEQGSAARAGTSVLVKPLDALPQVGFKFICDPAKPGLDDIAFAPALATPGANRGLGNVPEPIAEALSLLGEIAVERAKAGALSLLKDRFVTPLCGDPDQDGTGVRLSALGLGSTSLALPKSCTLLEQLRLEDVLSSGKPLLRALRDDLRHTIAPAAIDRLASGTPWGVIATKVLDVVNRAIDRGSFSTLDLEGVLDLFKDLGAFYGTAVLVDIAGQQRLVAAIAGALDAKTLAARCAWTKKPEQCAADLLDLLSTGELKTLLQQLTLASDPGLAQTIDELEAFATKLNATIALQLDALHIQISSLPGCEHTDNATVCALALARRVHSASDAAALVATLHLDRATIEKAVADWITSHIDSNPQISRAVGIACQGRLAVGILRKCSGTSCTKADIDAMFTNPASFFSHDDELPAKLCWSDTTTYRKGLGDNYSSFVTDGLELLASKETGAARAAIAVRMVARVSKDAAGCTTTDTPTRTCREITSIEDLLVALLEQDHSAALTAAISLAKQLVPRLPKALTKGAQLIGSVAAYAEVYKDTKAEDPKAARDARKKALEGLIDAATDRHGRARDTIVSFGSNVGLGMTYTEARGASQDAWTPQVRVPLGLAIDRLPPVTSHDLPIGLHLAITLGDLGQFAAVNDQGKVDTVRWDDFLSPGFEIGALLGAPERPFNISFHLEYAPALFADTDHAGALRFGFSLGYYVPFFDFN